MDSSTSPPIVGSAIVHNGKQAEASVYDSNMDNKTLVQDNDNQVQFDGTDDWEIPARVAAQKFFVQIDHEKIHSLTDAFDELDRVMQREGIGHLVSRKKARSFGGRSVEVGQIGLLIYKGRPILITKPGQYWNFSITHSWYSKFKYDLTEVTSVGGLTYAQVGQSEAMVVLDPSNQVFIVRNGGFAGYGFAGSYRVVEIVDTLNLGAEYAVIETDSSPSQEGNPTRVLGYKKEIKHAVMNGNRKQSVTIATFFNVPAQNTVVVQNGQHLRSLNAGQHVITNPRTTYRGFFTYGERQTSFRTEPAYTLEGVPVVLHVNLRYRVVDAIELTKSYETAFQALKNPAQSAVNAVVSRLSYQQFMRARKLEGDIPDYENMSWLEAFKSECMRDLSSHAIEYGVKVLSFDVLDRRLEGKLGEDLEKQAESVLRNQLQSTQVALQNRINTETEQGRLQVANVKAMQTQTEAEAAFLKKSKEADASYYQNLKEADAQAERVRRLAQAQADATAIETKQRVLMIEQIAAAEAKAIELQAGGYATVTSEHAQRMQLEEMEKQKFSLLPAASTLFVGGAEGNAKGVGEGFAWTKGLSLAQTK